MKVLCTPPVTVSVNSAIGLGWAGSSKERITMPFLRVDAPSRVSTPYFPSSVVITSLMVRASTTTESVIDGAAGLRHVDGVDPVADGAEVAVLPVGMEPELGSLEACSGSRPTSVAGRRTSRGRTSTVASAILPGKAGR